MDALLADVAGDDDAADETKTADTDNTEKAASFWRHFEEKTVNIHIDVCVCVVERRVLLMSDGVLDRLALVLRKMKLVLKAMAMLSKARLMLV